MSTDNLPFEESARPYAQAVEKAVLRNLNLRTGMAIQFRKLAAGASKREGQFYGAIDGKGVMLGPNEKEDLGLKQDDICIVRGFTGVYEFSFVSKVLQIFSTPFPYALLAYPATVDAQRARQSMRTPCVWPVVVQAAAEKILAQTVDLSPHGAMLSSGQPLGRVGDCLSLQLQVTIEGNASSIGLLGNIRHQSQTPGSSSYISGVAFQATGEQEKLMLHYLCQK
ncbi:PilZ domain-containing protein [Curvibacter sp. CHRR-16]|uniref:PilZ domain-containing protein n=1 Tax=Curvibacter sp. CHRR-16 TaxID=2835872 RepID=UPI001BDA8AC3|nr:PilZ domain-containing protein [Curvibacter sp. CHRR-16]MBT0571184.1 PilZ domain-containing protein [Curvibacter sp. CHRR-16]